MLLLLGIPALGIPAVASGEELGQRVLRAGESLSQIAFDELPGSVYHRRDGNLRKILALNPWIRDPRQLKPGQVILMPAAYTARKAKPAPLATRQVASVNEAVAEATPPPANDPAADPFTASSSLDFALGGDYFRLDATDRANGTTAALLSRMSPTARLAWRLDWSPAWSSILGFRVRADKMLPSDTAQKRLDNGDASSWVGFAGAEYRWSENGASRALLGRQDSLFLRSPNVNTVAIDRIGVACLSAEHEQTLFKVRAATAGVGVAGSFLFPSDGPGYRIQAGWGGRGSAFLVHQRESVSLRGDVFYAIQRQNSSIANQKLTTTGMSIGVSWRIP